MKVSRKWRLTWVSTTVTFVVATAFVLTGRMSAADWAGFLQWLLPAMSVAYGAANVAQTHAERPAPPKSEGDA